MLMQVRLFKQFQVSIHGDAMDSDKWRGSMLRSLVQYLATRRGLYATTDEIMEVFWGDSSPDKARSNLQVAVSRLRGLLKAYAPEESGDQFIVFTGPGYRLPEQTQVDFWEIHDQARNLRKLGAQDPAGALSFLDSLVIPDPTELLPEHPFADWAMTARRQAQVDITSLYLLRAELRAQGRRRHEALEDYRRVLAMDPTREPVAQLAMRLAADIGDRPSALEIFHRCRTALLEELGLDPSPELTALHTQILREDAAPGSLMSDDRDKAEPMVGKMARKTNLPSNLSSFVGRGDDLAAVSALLSPLHTGAEGQRLVTLTGPGGSGKTRLGLEVGRGLLNAFPDGVWLVELAELRDSSLVPNTVAATFELQGAPGQPALEVLSTFISTRRLLLILDNCEHLPEGCTNLVEQLLRHCPELRILATSRQSLSLAGETIWSVPPLPIPDPRTTTTLEQFRESPVVRLFTDRARSVFPRFEITEENAAHVAFICRCLDGMPLALELAAARARLLSVREIAERLRDRFTLLTYSISSAATRHQTLRSTLDWSYDLLTEEERTLFRRLSVFAGSFGLEAAEAICAGSDLMPSRVMDLLHGLVDKSLVIADLHSFPARFKLLETIREYAAERHEQAGETAATWHRNLLWWRDLAETAEPRLIGEEQVTWYERLDTDLDNLRVTLDWANRSGETMTGLQVALSLWRFWVARNHSHEGGRWLDLFLTKSRAQAPTALQAKALIFSAGLCLSHGDAPRAHTYAAEACTVAGETQDRFLQAQATGLLGTSKLMLGDAPSAVEHLRTSMVLAESIGDDWTPAEASLWLGVMAWLHQDLTRAESHLNRSHATFTQRKDLWNLALASSFLARVATDLRDFVRARRLLRETLSLYFRMRDKRLLACALIHLARLERGQENPYRAVRLLGVVDALLERSGATVAAWIDWVAWVSFEYHLIVKWGRTALTADTHREAYTAGWSMSLEEAIASAEEPQQ